MEDIKKHIRDLLKLDAVYEPTDNGAGDCDALVLVKGDIEIKISAGYNETLEVTFYKREYRQLNTNEIKEHLNNG